MNVQFACECIRIKSICMILLGYMKLILPQLCFYFQDQSPLSVYNLLARVSVVLEVLEVVTILQHIG